MFISNVLTGYLYLERRLAISLSCSPCQAPSPQNLEKGVRIDRGRGKGERKAERFFFESHSLEFKVLQNSGMQDAEHADHGLFATQAEVNGCGMAGEEGRICTCLAC